MDRPTDLAGELELSLNEHHADFFTRNLAVLLVQQRLGPGVRYAAWVAIERHAVADESVYEAAQLRVLDKLRPWARPDRNPLPCVTLFPLLTRAHRLAARAIGYLTPRRKDAG